MIPGSGNNQISLEAPEKAGKSSDPPGNLRKVMKHGSSIPAENVLFFSDDLRTCPAETNGKLAESHRKNKKKSGLKIASIFHRFPMFSCKNRPVLLDLEIRIKIAEFY